MKLLQMCWDVDRKNHKDYLISLKPSYHLFCKLQLNPVLENNASFFWE